MNNRANRFYPSPRGTQSPRRRGGRHESLVRAINYWRGDESALQQAQRALDDIVIIGGVPANAGVLSLGVIDLLDERLDTVHAALLRFSTPWGPR